jgi:hypothetical protein
MVWWKINKLGELLCQWEKELTEAKKVDQLKSLKSKNQKLKRKSNEQKRITENRIT